MRAAIAAKSAASSAPSVLNAAPSSLAEQAAWVIAASDGAPTLNSDAPVSAPVDFRNRRLDISFFFCILSALLFFQPVKLPHAESPRSAISVV
jgi:hypothetical protein